MFFGESQISHIFSLALIALVKTLGLEKYWFSLLVIQKCLDFVVYFGSGESHIGYNIFLEQVYLMHLIRGSKPEYLTNDFHTLWTPNGFYLLKLFRISGQPNSMFRIMLHWSAGP